MYSLLIVEPFALTVTIGVVPFLTFAIYFPFAFPNSLHSGQLTVISLEEYPEKEASITFS